MFFANCGKILRFRRGNVAIQGMREGEMWPYGALRKWEGRNRNALPLRSGRSSTKLENTSLSTDVPLGFLYAAFPLPPLRNENCCSSLIKRIRYIKSY